MSHFVWIPSEHVVGMVESQMMYGAIIRYNKGGIEFHEMLAEDDYEPLYGLDELMEEFGID